jgi:alanine racemase
MVRPSLMVHGVVPPGKRKVNQKLVRLMRSALSFHSRVSYRKSISKATILSYGRPFTAHQKMEIAAVASGDVVCYSLSASNHASVLIRVQICLVVGRVTMDQCLMDVTSLFEVNVGDQVKQSITAPDLVHQTHAIPWQILASITHRVPRIYRTVRPF